MDKILVAVKEWINDFVGAIVNDRARFVRAPEGDFVSRLAKDMKNWIDLLNEVQRVVVALMKYLTHLLID